MTPALEAYCLWKAENCFTKDLPLGNTGNNYSFSIIKELMKTNDRQCKYSDMTRAEDRELDSCVEWANDDFYNQYFGPHLSNKN